MSRGIEANGHVRTDTGLLAARSILLKPTDEADSRRLHPCHIGGGVHPQLDEVVAASFSSWRMRPEFLQANCHAAGRKSTRFCVEGGIRENAEPLRVMFRFPSGVFARAAIGDGSDGQVMATKLAARADFGVDSIGCSAWESFHAVSLKSDSVALSIADVVVGVCFCRAPTFQFQRRSPMYDLRRCSFCFPRFLVRPTEHCFRSGLGHRARGTSRGETAAGVFRAYRSSASRSLEINFQST